MLIEEEPDNSFWRVGRSHPGIEGGGRVMMQYLHATPKTRQKHGRNKLIKVDVHSVIIS